MKFCKYRSFFISSKFLSEAKDYPLILKEKKNPKKLSVCLPVIMFIIAVNEPSNQENPQWSTPRILKFMSLKMNIWMWIRSFDNRSVEASFC